MKTTTGLIVLSAIGLAPAVHAEVRETHENAFVIESSVSTSASPAAVFTTIGKVSTWWDPQHTWSGSAKNLRLPLQAGGCFCETLPAGGSVQHGRVIFS